MYLFFIKNSTYLVLRHKKKKFVNLINGIINCPFPNIEGIIGVSKANSMETIYLYNMNGIYTVIAKNELENLQTDSLFKVGKDGKKKKSKALPEESSPQQNNLLKEATEPPEVEESTINLKSLIKKEIDEGIKTLVLPIIESHMKRFESEFRELIGHEVDNLKGIVQNETIKMTSTGKVFEMFMKRMMEVSRRFTESLGQQMKILAANKTRVSESPVTTESPFAIPSQPIGYRGMEQPPISQYGIPMADYGRPIGYDYPPPGYLSGTLSRPPGI